MSLTVKAYVSDGSTLLAFDLPKPDNSFAGFAIQRTPHGGTAQYLLNRLSFTNGVSVATTAETRVWTNSNEAPFQKFHWVDFPPTDETDQYTYTVTAMYFAKGGGLEPRESAHVDVDFSQGFRATFSHFHAGFTRGYLSSQAYAARFQNAPIRPTQKTFNYDTAPFEKQYVWLGYTARKMVFDFLKECLEDKSLKVDLFAYDLDEPDFISGLLQLAHEGRLRAFLDDSKLHTSPTAVEPNVLKALRQIDANNVVTGHFNRFAHDKVLIQRDKQGRPLKVLAGSANFSVRGLYVQANNVLTMDDPVTAATYGQVFELAFGAAKQPGSGSAAVSTAFKKSPLSTDWAHPSESANPSLPKFDVSFAPHADPNVSLSVVDDAIKNAKSSVIFAVMELSGGGDVLQSLCTLDERSNIFSYGVTQNAGGVSLFRPGSAQHGEFATFSYLSKQVPQPFRAETSGGMGQVIHNKFVVVDFNGDNPVVFTGSSNLAAGGEGENGDNLLAIYDRNIAAGYAVEAIRLVDHYHFRMLQQQHPASSPVTLQGAGSTQNPWWAPYYEEGTNKFFERVLFVSDKEVDAMNVAPPLHPLPKPNSARAIAAASKDGKSIHTRKRVATKT